MALTCGISAAHECIGCMECYEDEPVDTDKHAARLEEQAELRREIAEDLEWERRQLNHK